MKLFMYIGYMSLSLINTETVSYSSCGLCIWWPGVHISRVT